MQEHGYIRFYRIPYHIADLKGNTIRIIQSDNRAIVPDPYIQFSAITVMIQREVAKRICAQPGTSDYGAFSLYCQYHAQCELLFEVPPDCFTPAPKVTSAGIQLTPTQQPPVAVSDEGFLFRGVRAAFPMRRKTLANGLANGFSGQLTKGEITELIQSCGFAPTVRGEQLGLAEFAQLADAIQSALN